MALTAAALRPDLAVLGRPAAGLSRRSRRRRRLSSMASYLRANDDLDEDVVRMFLTERQLHGDFISKVSDVLWRRNGLEQDISDTSTTQECGLQYSDVEEDKTSGGFLKLASARDWISGDSVPPINKKLAFKDWIDESDKRKKLNLLRYEALKGELLLLTCGIGAACTVYCLFNFSSEVAISYASGVLFSCLYLQLLNYHADNISESYIPDVFLRRRSNRKIGVRSEDLKNFLEKTLAGISISLSSPRIIIPAAIYGLWAMSNRLNDFPFHLKLVPAMMGFFAYKAAALVQVYRDNEDLRLIFPESESEIEP